MKTYRSDALTLDISGKRAELRAQLPQAARHVKIVLESGRNAPLTNYADVSPRKPSQPAPVAAIPQNVWLPVVDVQVCPGMAAVIEMENCLGGDYTWNYWLGQEIGMATSTLHLAGHRLLEWENILWFERAENKPARFSLTWTVPQIPSMSLAFRTQWNLLTESWYGEVSVYAVHGAEETLVGTVSVPKVGTQVTRRAGKLDKENLLAALDGCVGYILNSRVTATTSPSEDGFYLFYDLDGETYRNALWPWGWGPAIRSLLDAAEVPEIAQKHGKQALRDAARAAGKTSLQYFVYNPGHLADRLSTSRYDPNPRMPNGMRERICLSADGGFLCGWAWIPLYEATGDERFLEAATTYSDRVAELCDQYGIPPQDYATEAGDYTPHTLDESGFGTEAFEGLYRVTGDEKYKALSRRYMDAHTAKFRRPDGLWQRLYRRAEDTTEDCIFMTRGLGWAMEGLLASHRTVKGDTDTYLQQAVEMAEQLMRYQRADGGWSFRFTEPEAEVGTGEKAVALWSLLFYQLYRETRDARHLDAARRALGWCLAHQVTGGVAEAIGGVPGASPQSAVVYREWFEMSCLYTVGFFAEALLEELKLG